MFSVMTALITPFLENGEVDYPSLGGIIQDQLQQGCQGFIVCGTTAEAPTLSEPEKFSILSFVIQQVKHRVPIWFGCGSNHTKQTIQLCLKAQSYDIAGFLIVTPYYNRPSQEGIYQHYKAISDAVFKDIMLYNVPSRTGVDITYETLRRLLTDCENIKALKHATNALDIIKKIHHEFPDFMIYSGEDGSFVEGRKAGMNGLISVMSHINMRDILDYLHDPSSEKLEDLYACAYHTFLESSPAPIKYMLCKRGLCQNNLRLPLCPVGEDTEKKLDDFLS